MNENGLRTYDFHAEDEPSDQVIHALRAERSVFPAFRTTDVVGLANLDPETAARQHLQQVLSTEAIPSLATSAPRK